MAQTWVTTTASELKLDIPLVDNDHRILFDLFTDLEDATLAGEDVGIIGSFLNMIIEYSSYHFAREEALMSACGVDNLEDHKTEHRQILEGLLKLRNRYFSDNAQPLNKDEMNLCRAWLVDHISDWDETYCETLRGRPDEVRAVGETFAENAAVFRNGNGFV